MERHGQYQFSYFAAKKFQIEGWQFLVKILYFTITIITFYGTNLIDTFADIMFQNWIELVGILIGGKGSTLWQENP